MSAKLFPGDPAPWFTARSSVDPKHRFDRAGGNYILLTFVRDGRQASEQALLADILAGATVFDDLNARWFIVTGESGPEHLPLRIPGIRAFFDPGNAIRALYGIDGYGGGAVSMVLSPRLQVIAMVADPDPGRHAGIVLNVIKMQTPVSRLSSVLGPPPILMIPDVFEPALCQLLINGYVRQGGEASGFMVDENGKTVEKFNDRIKVRRDWIVDDTKLNEAILARFVRRVAPEIRKAYNVQIMHMERHLVGCYSASDGGHFSAHRDNEALGAIHRQFACSLNLNAGDYEGGELRFPEFGPETYKPPTGGCCIFSCSLLHAATRVTSGTRYVFLPFLHDAASEQVRLKNLHHLAVPERANA